MGGGAFDLLKPAGIWPRSEKQPKITCADLARILSIGLSKPHVVGGLETALTMS
jgi:hypothetical protein